MFAPGDNTKTIAQVLVPPITSAQPRPPLRAAPPASTQLLVMPSVPPSLLAPKSLPLGLSQPVPFPVKYRQQTAPAAKLVLLPIYAQPYLQLASAKQENISQIVYALIVHQANIVTMGSPELLSTRVRRCQESILVTGRRVRWHWTVRGVLNVLVVPLLLNAVTMSSP